MPASCLRLVSRTQTPRGVEVASFYQPSPFTFAQLPPAPTEDLEIYLWEDVWGPDVAVGEIG